MKRIKTYLRSTTSGNRLNHCMLLHVHCKKTDQLNMIEIAKEFVGDNQANLVPRAIFSFPLIVKRCAGDEVAIKQDCKHLAGFENIKNSPRITTINSKQKQKKVNFPPPPSNEENLPTPLHNFFFIVLVYFFLSKI